MIELGKLLLDDETAAAFTEWLQGLVEQRRRGQQDAEDKKAKDAQDEVWYKQLTAIAEKLATRQGPIVDMDSWEQAMAACASWEPTGDYFEMDDDFEMDDQWRQVWYGAYSRRIDDLRRARNTQS